eukprot:823454-Pleurochrysis_carterae.AAC.2
MMLIDILKKSVSTASRTWSSAAERRHSVCLMLPREGRDNAASTIVCLRSTQADPNNNSTEAGSLDQVPPPAALRVVDRVVPLWQLLVGVEAIVEEELLVLEVSRGQESEASQRVLRGRPERG